MKIQINKNNIGIFVLAYKRLDHLKRCIKNIRKYLSHNDKVYIFCDNYSDNCSDDEKKQVRRVKYFLSQLSKKKNYKVVARTKRLGMKHNWFEAYDQMFSKYQKVICLEDDIIINKHFFPFMKFYLNHFEDNKKIMSITGFASRLDPFPLQNYEFDCYLTTRPMSWGQATWRRVWFKFNKINLVIYS